MKKLLPVSEDIIDQVYNIVCPEHYADGKWAGFPAPDGGKKEQELYGPFVKIANAILIAAEIVVDGPSRPDLLRATSWVDYHSKSPKSQDKDGATIRPDCLLALSTVRDRVQKMELETKNAVWWLQIITVLEMKRVDSEPWEDVVKQLIGYLRRVMQEQLDRRFVFGFTLGPSRMSIWVHDRSGVLGTQTPIDIHKDPRNFIRLITAFAVLPADKLGFDLSMKLFISPLIYLHSYALTEAHIDIFRAGPYERKWVIELNNGETYRTVKTLSVAQAGVMRGRGTIAWVVVRCDQKGKDQNVYVLKQSWKPLGVKGEGELFEAASGSKSKFLGEIHYWEDVKVRDEKDETGTLIRQGLVAISPSPVVVGKKRQRSEAEEPFLHIECTDKGDIKSILSEGDRKPVSRVRTRILLSTYGWPIKYFATLKELLQVLQDAIKGHKHLYNNGVLHRDISPGNILIGWVPGAEIIPNNSRGRLIDLDHAKDGKQCRTPDTSTSRTEELQDATTSRNDQAVAGLLTGRLKPLIGVQNLNIQTSLVFRAREAIPLYPDYSIYSLDAVQHAAKFGTLPQDGSLSDTSLNWRAVKKSYDYQSTASVLQQGSRTGALPYTSYEILSGQPYCPAKEVHHDAVHDLESFFWVLVYICMTRKGPGGGRRTELTTNASADKDTADKDVLVQSLVWELFDADNDTLCNIKKTVYQDCEAYMPKICANLHPFFDKLQNLVLEWYSLLQLAYKHRAYEYNSIHDSVIVLLDKAMQSLDSSSNDLDKAAQEVVDFRQEDIKRITAEEFSQKSPQCHETSPKKVNPTTLKSSRHCKKRKT